MNPEELKALIRIVEESEIDELEIRRWGRTVRIVKQGRSGSATAVRDSGSPAISEAGRAGEAAATPVESSEPAQTVAGTTYHEVVSPMVGTFYSAPSPEASPFVEVGDHVRTGQTLCILEAMKLMNELQSDISGVVRKISVENGKPVEYGQVLFEIET